MGFDFAAFEAELYTELHAALARFARGHRKQTYYAVALYGVYRELDGQLSLPALATSSEEEGPPPENPSTFWGWGGGVRVAPTRALSVDFRQ